MRKLLSRAAVAAAATLACLAAAQGAFAGNNVTVVQPPAAGSLNVTKLIVHAKPDPSSRAVVVLRQFREDYRWQIVLANAVRKGTDGNLWYRLSLAMRPNNTQGWVPAAALDLHPVANRIVVRRGARTIEVMNGSRVLLRAKVAVGAPGMETPLGQFYVTARFVPDDPFLGAFAVETSAYSRLTEWPGGGKVGIHGTSRPELLGQAVSHGCIRVSNATATALKRLAPLGTPISVRA
jgi:lipoprotein-anchoring transpeptidase ErfK/SrfK